MILLFTSADNPTFVEREIHHIEGLTEDEKFGGIEVENLPEPEHNGMIPRLHINKDTLEMWYEYEVPPISQEQEMETLRQRQAEQDSLLMTLLLGGMPQ